MPEGDGRKPDFTKTASAFEAAQRGEVLNEGARAALFRGVREYKTRKNVITTIEVARGLQDLTDSELRDIDEAVARVLAKWPDLTDDERAKIGA